MSEKIIHSEVGVLTCKDQYRHLRFENGADYSYAGFHDESDVLWNFIDENGGTDLHGKKIRCTFELVDE